ncbi:hypothetical protein D0C36_16625 [Mucilaginibacter conchicola]|uniref:Alpha-L-rhamnosidase six-hairpin glycosidase domain-containing protein n=1 Tax=Mucilaginibacter conchicola TaxID=2303333 RepID=A0A372NQP8_9SPHI|nr:hypothetical protein [Mucilaginibacter conchicola]RFZ90593.1 hypothetical protein D0C36_16625 [Mucilaginibacter conchicola]
MKPFYLRTLAALCSLQIVTGGLQAQQLINQRQITLLEQAKRPQDPWPRGDGHILIAEPGSPLAQKGYEEPGGSFSPGPGSFGVSIWVYDKNKKLIATSDDIAMDKIKQAYVYKNNNSIPSVETVTPYYTCSWTYLEAGRWEFSFKNNGQQDYQYSVVTRSVGPAGGPLTTATWEGDRLLINHRYIITLTGDPKSVTVGNEAAGELQKDIPEQTTMYNGDGWAFARLNMGNTPFGLKINDTKPQFNSPLPYSRTIQQFGMQLPDKAFERSLQAQVSNLMMGYIGRQTGPGEPVNYPLAWERDGAYSLVAMAKSGHLETARELSRYFAENDFFGGFGAEGDAPGSAINALTEVAYLINDPAYYQYVWPHIKRKLKLIDEMRNAKTEIYKDFIGPLAPHIEHDVKRRQLIARPFSEGLIVGTMDNHFPVLYINAISYRGLVQASRLAAKFGETALADSCLKKAAEVKAAWTEGFGKQKYENERNFMISVWPSWITNKGNELFRKKIEEKHAAEWGTGDSPKDRPLWTYFSAAEAHQWLFLDRTDRVWQTLHYFWNNQCSPGLYTYWEGDGEENTFRQWENYRGWLKPKYITPHYWTASEMLLLQLDMLVYVNEAKGDDFEFVIGAGVPASWLKESMSIKNFHTKAGNISWEYKKNVLNVTVQGAPKRYAVRPGIAFINAKTKVNVTYK